MQGLTAVSPARWWVLRWRGSGGGLGGAGSVCGGARRWRGCSGEVLAPPCGLGVEEEAGDAPGAPGAPREASERRGQEVEGARVFGSAWGKAWPGAAWEGGRRKGGGVWLASLHGEGVDK